MAIRKQGPDESGIQNVAAAVANSKTEDELCTMINQAVRQDFMCLYLSGENGQLLKLKRVEEGPELESLLSSMQ